MFKRLTAACLFLLCCTLRDSLSWAQSAPELQTESVTGEFNGVIIPMKRVLLTGDHRFNTIAKLWLTRGTEFFVIADQYLPYDNGAFVEGNKNGALNKIFIAEKAVNRGTIYHEIKHNIHLQRRQQGKITIFDGHIKTGSSGYYPDLHLMEEYFNWPTDFTRAEGGEILIKAKAFQDIASSAIATVETYQRFIATFLIDVKEMRYFKDANHIYLWDLHGGAGLRLYQKKIGGTNVVFINLDRGPNYKNISIDFPLLGKDLPTMGELAAGLDSDGWLVDQRSIRRLLES